MSNYGEFRVHRSDKRKEKVQEEPEETPKQCQAKEGPRQTDPAITLANKQFIVVTTKGKRKGAETAPETSDVLR